LFTGRRVDILDEGSLKIQYNRNRYYDYYTGRWTTHDPIGYIDGVNLYGYAASNPLVFIDSFGLQKNCCNPCVPGAREIRVLNIGRLDMWDVRLVAFEGSVLASAGWSKFSDPVSWIKSKIQDKTIDGLKDMIWKRAGLFLIPLSTSMFKMHFEFRFRAEVTFEMRECEPKCWKRVWWPWLGLKKRPVKWGWSEPEKIAKRISTEWFGEDDGSDYFIPDLSDLKWTLNAAMENAKHIFKKYVDVSWESFEERVAESYGAEIVEEFEKPAECSP
jgi:RHS repeat-associated protein